MTDLATTTQGALTYFGQRDEIKELGERLQKMMPGATRYTESEALTVAQLAVAHNLDPFNGEIWGIKGNNGKWYGVMVGIKGLRKAARRQMLETDGSYWTEFRRVTPEEYDVKAKDAVVYECKLRDTESTQAWGKSISALVDSGIPYVDAVEMLGKSPMVTGVGIADPSEQSKMELHARAKKRAEADAIKQRFDVEFSGTQYNPEYVDYDPEQVEVLDEPRERDPRFDPAETIREIGFEVVDTPIEEQPPIEEPIFDENNAVDLYEQVVNSKGVPYKDCELHSLTYMYSALNKKAKNFQEPTNDEELAAQNEILLKRDAAHYYINLKKESE